MVTGALGFAGERGKALANPSAPAVGRWGQGGAGIVTGSESRTRRREDSTAREGQKRRRARRKKATEEEIEDKRLKTGHTRRALTLSRLKVFY